MNKEVKKYIDQQIAWVRDIKKTENYWIEKFLESEQRSQKEMTEAYKQSMETWKQNLVEWKDRIEQSYAQMVTRREMRTMVVTVITILISFLGLLCIIFLKK